MINLKKKLVQILSSTNKKILTKPIQTKEFKRSLDVYGT